MKLYKIDPVIISMLNHAMNKWKTTLILNQKGKQAINAGTIPINRGIFQGDGLSAFWFCLSLNPLSTMLNDRIHREQEHITSVLNHLWYMDDLKLYANSKQEMEELLRKTKVFSDDIRMSFGTDKCRIHIMEKGKWSNGSLNSLTDSNDIATMEKDELYKYLGYQQARGIDHKPIKKDLTDVLKQRLKMVLKTQLSARNKFQAINTFAISAITYSFGVIQ
jgi:hypothetical protein